jgi:hypothetical protein
MAFLRRLASSSLLAAGLLLVFGGISAALGFSGAGVVASLAVIAALLYAGGVWFDGAPSIIPPAGADKVLVFDRALRVTAGAAPGASLLSQFPEPLHREIDARCRAALRGEHTHFFCEHAGRRLAFDVSPVQTIDGPVLYGVLICGPGARPATVGAAPLTTVS